MGCICVMTNKDFDMMYRLNRPRLGSSYSFGKVRYINQTAKNVIVNIEGDNPTETSTIVKSLKKMFPDTVPIKENWNRPASHHIFPHEFEDRFRKYDIEVDDFTVLWDVKEHRELHLQEYNAQWKMVLDYCDKVDKKQAKEIIVRVAGQLSSVYGWTGAGIQVHKTHDKKGIPV